MGQTRVEEVQLVRVTAHGGVVLLDEEPADLILGHIGLLLGDDVCGGGGLGGLEGGGVEGGVGGIVGIGRVGAVHGRLGGIGHDGAEGI